MKSLEEQMLAYSAYHQHTWNKMTHFIGVPLVVYSIFIPMGWFRFAPLPDWPLTGATIFYASTMIYYFRLDTKLALMVLPVTGFLLYLSDLAAQAPFQSSFYIFLATFVGGWIFQLVGHWFEGKRPALADNFMQIFNAPLFLCVEILIALGLRKDLKAKIEALPG